MIYRQYLKYSATFIDSYKKFNNYGGDQLLQLSKYKDDQHRQIQNRILFNPNVQYELNKFKSYNKSDNDPEEGTYNLSAVSTVLDYYRLNYSIYEMQKNWVLGYGSTVNSNNVDSMKSGVSWVTYNGSTNWITPGGDYIDNNIIYQGQLFYNKQIQSLNLRIPCLNLLSYNGYIIKPKYNFGKVSFFKNGLQNACNIPPYIEFKIDDYEYDVGNSPVVNNLNNQILILIKNHSRLRSKSKQRIYLQFNYLYSGNRRNQNLVVDPDTLYQIVESKSRKVIIPKDQIYTRVSSDGLRNYFDIITNCLDASIIYSINIYINNIRYETGYRFSVV